MSGRLLIRRGAGVAATIAALAVAAAVLPLPGSPTRRADSAPLEGDPAFNGGAARTIPFTGSLTTSGDAVVQAADGSVYVAGSTDAGGGDAFVAHLSPAGALISSFGSGGVATIDLGSASDRVADLAVGPGGTIVLAGSANGPTGNDVVLARLTGAGALDATFGTGGKTVTDLGGDDHARSLGFDGAGRSVVLVTSGASVGVMRYTAAGALDTSYGSGGIATPPIGSPSATSGALAVGADGAAYVAGSVPASPFNGPPNSAMGVGKLTPTGSPDPAFGTNGASRPDDFDPRAGTGAAVALRGDGSVWVAGSGSSSLGQVSLVIVSAAGQASTFFGGSTSFGDIAEGVEAVFPTDFGAVVAVRGGGAFTLYARTTSADPVSGFGSSGAATVDLGVAHAVAAGSGNSFVVAGSSGGSALVAEIDASGQPNGGFGTGGQVAVSVQTPRDAAAGAVTVSGTGKILVASNLTGGAGGIGLVQLLANGEDDPTFGDGNGRASLASYPTWVPYNGNLVSRLLTQSSGYTLMSAGPELVRITPTGELDTTYGRFGRFVVCNECRVTDVASGVGERTVAVGRNADGVATLALSSRDGVADETVNRSGFLELPWAFSGDVKVATLADRRMMVAGPSLADPNSVVVARLSSNGTPESTFGGGPNGVATTLAVTGPKQVLGLFVTGDGKVIVAARSGNRLILARFNDDGGPDASFGPTGSATPGVVVVEVTGMTGAGSAAMSSTGKIFVPATLDQGGTSVGAVFRFAANGVDETAAALGGPGTFDLSDASGANAVAAGANGEPVAVGTTTSEGHSGLAVRRFRAGPNGTPPSTSAPSPTTSTTVSPSPLPTFAGRFHALSPARILDTRAGVGAAQARVGAGSMIDLAVTGRGGVPATGVASVALSVIGVSPSALTYLTIYPAGEATPLASNLNIAPGAVVNNMVVAKVGVGGAVRLFNAAGTIDLVADVVGWFDDGNRTDGAQFNALSPNRLLDTRSGVGAPLGAVRASSLVDLTVIGVGGVPASGVSAVVLNVGVTQPTAATFITAFPTGEALPTTSNLNAAANETSSKLVIAKVGAGGKVSLFNGAGSVQLIADVVGWFDAGVPSPTTAFTGMTPARLLDTRSGVGAPVGKIGAQKNVLLDVRGQAGIPSNARSVILNLTATEATAQTYLTVYPATDALPFAASLNVPANATVANLVVAKLGTDGKVRIFNAAGNVSVVADVVGWFS